MNKKQISYHFGRVVHGYPDILFLANAGPASYSYFALWHPNIGWGAVAAAGVALSVFGAYVWGSSRIRLHRQSKVINNSKSRYPLEHATKIIIDDYRGLQHLLERTREREWGEWGTFLKAHPDKQRAVVYKILHSIEAERRGFIRRWGLATFDSRPMESEGEFNGRHHYHPLGGAFNFTVSTVDRYKPLNSIDLLTFNMPEGPEIIGYNRQYTYIPLDSAKRRLVRATPREIMKYLSR